MEINLNAKYERFADVLQFVTDESRKELLQQAAKIRDPYSLTLAEFFACCEGDFSIVNTEKVGGVCWVENFAVFVEEFSKAIKRMTVQQTPEQKQASAACLPVEWQEGMLVFARRYFGLKSFSEAEKVTIADFLIAKKDDYNTTIYERALHKIQTNKLKHK